MLFLEYFFTQSSSSSLSYLSLRYKILCIIMDFFVLLSIWLSSCLVHFKQGPDYVTRGGARGVMVIVIGNGHDWYEFKSWMRLIAFHIALIPLGKVWIQLFSLQLRVNSRAVCIFNLGEATSLGEGKLWIQTC